MGKANNTRTDSAPPTVLLNLAIRIDNNTCVFSACSSCAITDVLTCLEDRNAVRWQEGFRSATIAYAETMRSLPLKPNT